MLAVYTRKLVCLVAPGPLKLLFEEKELLEGKLRSRTIKTQKEMKGLLALFTSECCRWQ